MIAPHNTPFEHFNLWYEEMRGQQKSHWGYLFHPVMLFKKILQALFGLLFPAVNRIHSNAVILATASKGGLPSSRVVLLKKYDQEGFYFYTNYNSHKGQNLAENPQASLNFYWEFPPRQVRIYGKVEKTSYKDSSEYWASRPKESQISALISNQSHKINSPEELKEKVIQARAQYQNSPIECPKNWGGFKIIPQKFEFWQARGHRLHDRLVYELNSDNHWQTYFLAP